VIGSGFGGSVAAMRLAQKGYRVVVIEAGKRWSGDDFPKSSWDARRYLWAPAIGCRGIQRMTLMKHALVLGGVGVGGGSLVYGNTLIRPMASFFEHPTVAAMGGAEAITPYYDLAERMMGVVANPRITEADRLVRETAEEYGRGDTFTPSPVGVYFGSAGEVAADPYFGGEGPERVGCTSCGGCFIGCRVGAKNTLDRNYLYFAEKLGAEVLAESRVVRLTPIGDAGEAGYQLSLKATGAGGRSESCEVGGVVVSAGVVGTVALLAAARERGDLPRISPRIGDAVRTNSEVIVGVSARDRKADLSKGISASTSVFPDDHTQIQADRYAAGSDSMMMLSTLMVDGGGALWRPLRLLAAILRHPIDALRTLWPFGRARRTIILVVMQDRDSSLRFVRRRRWWWPFSRRVDSALGDGESVPTYIPIANDFARRLAKRMNGIPMSATSEVLLNRPVTAHILGGCPTGDDGASGVIDRDHRVHGYSNLMVCDGSVIPANLGVNPALSILALSERAMAKVPAKSEPHRFGFERDWGVEALL